MRNTLTCILVMAAITIVGAKIQATKKSTILDENRNQLEEGYISRLEGYKARPIVDSIPAALMKEIATTETPGIYVAKGNAHLQDNINQSIYFTQLPSGNYEILIDENHPMETFINLLTAYPYIDKQTAISLKLNLYGNRKSQVELPLRQLLDHAIAEGETAYVGLEREAEDALEIALFLDNTASGYEHVVYIKANPTNVAAGGSMLEGEAYLYCPKATDKSQLPNHGNSK